MQHFVAPQNEGVVNHDSAAGWTIDHSTITGNAGAGTMLGSDNTLSWNCLTRNQQYGFNAFSDNGPSNLAVEHNEISDNGSNTGTLTTSPGPISTRCFPTCAW